MTTTFAEIVDQVRELDHDSKQELMDLIHTWLVEERREEILRTAQAAEDDHAHGRAKSGNVDDLMADLHARD